MGKLRESLAAKVAAWILILLSGITILAGTLGAYAIGGLGLYTKSFEEIEQERFRQINGNYSAQVLSNLGTGQNEADFKDTNFQYGVVQASYYSQLEKLDLNDAKTYVETNFSQNVNLEDLNLFQCNLNEDTNIYYTTNTLFGSYYITHSTQDYTKKNIRFYVYDTRYGTLSYMTEDETFYTVPKIRVLFYAQADNGEEWKFDRTYEYLPEKRAYTAVEEAVGQETAAAEDADGRTETAVEETNWESADSQTIVATEEADEEKAALAIAVNVKEDGTVVDAGDCERAAEVFGQETWTFNELDLEKFTFDLWNTASVYPDSRRVNTQNLVDTNEWHLISQDITADMESDSQYQNRVDYKVFSDGTLYVLTGNQKLGTDYYVLSIVPDADKLSRKEGTIIFADDPYVQWVFLLKLADRMKYSVYAVLGLAVIVFVVCLVFLIQSAGHKKGVEGIRADFFCRIPADLFAVLLLVVEWALLFIVALMSSQVDGDHLVFYLVMIPVVLFVGGSCLLGGVLNFAVRIKLGKWWRNTLIYKAARRIRAAFERVNEHISDLWKGFLLFFGFNFVEVMLFVIFGVGYSQIMVIWFCEKAILLIAGTILLIQMQELKEAGHLIAEGDLSYKVETKKMIPALKQHGDDLNRISEGVLRAVDEKMKSERFKTELITNVSHDIKTPLTSIINYVDLLEKEGAQSETAQEYLEVLERQSARLKKLIEDLIEASKASSGSLSVHFEKLDAGVFLVQTVGEFEEKTEKSGLKLMIKKPEEPVYILADGRHFWRVIDNLMNNICKYAQPQTRVYIDLEQTGEEVKITFRNTSKYALNITSEELMERFVRGDSSRNTEGNGLGLSIAGSLMERMNGKMRLYVDGDLFKVELSFHVAEK